MSYTASLVSSKFNVDGIHFGKVLKHLEYEGFVPKYDYDGNITEIDFVADYIGDPGSMFSKIAPYVKDGSYIEMRGEDGYHWKYIFSDGKCKEVTAKVSWEE